VSESDDERERVFWKKVIRVTWTAVVVLLALGGLSVLTWLLGWQRYLLLCLVGLLAGLAILTAMLGSARARELTSLVLGAVTLPLLAAYLGGVAARGEVPFTAHSATLLPFFTHATVVILVGWWISRAWQRGAARPGAGDQPGETRSDEGAVP
jgi:hypothetical protein